jgi:hypothetical protein
MILVDEQVHRGAEVALMRDVFTAFRVSVRGGG